MPKNNIISALKNIIQKILTKNKTLYIIINHKVKQNLKNKFIEKESNINWHYREFRMVEAEHWDFCEKSFGEDYLNIVG